MSQLSQLDKMNRPLSTGQHEVLSVDDLLKKMRMGKQYSSELRIGDQKIPVRVLSADEVNGLRKQARTVALRHNGDNTDELLILQKLTILTATQIGHSGVSVVSEEALNKMSLDELTYIYSAIMAFWEDCNPCVEKISPEKFRELVEALKKNIISWSDCSMPERKAIFTCFVELIQRPDTATSPTVN